MLAECEDSIGNGAILDDLKFLFKINLYSILNPIELTVAGKHFILSF